MPICDLSTCFDHDKRFLVTQQGSTKHGIQIDSPEVEGKSAIS